jgi:uracil-DNA glycosylase family 4
MVVGDGPSRIEMDKRLGFTDQKAMLLYESLTEVGIDAGRGGEVFYTYLCKCHTAGKVKIKNARTCAEEYLNKEIILLKPRLILALGKTAQTVLINSVSPLSKTHGKVYDLDVTTEDGTHSTQVIPIEHPFSILSNPARRDLWMADLRRVKAVLYGEGDPYWDDSKLDRFDFRVIEDEDHLLQTARRLIRDYKGGYLSIDVEASGLDTAIQMPDFKVFTLQFGVVNTEDKWANYTDPVYILPIQSEHFKCMPLDRIKFLLNHFLNWRYWKIVAHNGKYDFKALRTLGVVNTYLWWDTMMLWANAHGEAPLSLKEIAYQVTDLGGYEQGMNEYFDEHDTYDAPPEIMVPYSGLDVVVTRHLMYEMENSILNKIDPAILEEVDEGDFDSLKDMLFT